MTAEDGSTLPNRALLLVLVTGTVVITLLVQGFTLAPMVAMGYWQHPRMINLNTPDDVVAETRRRMAAVTA